MRNVYLGGVLEEEFDVSKLEMQRNIVWTIHMTVLRQIETAATLMHPTQAWLRLIQMVWTSRENPINNMVKLM
jgi:hypothetical protein